MMQRCCCLNLRSGAIALAWLGLIGCIATLSNVFSLKARSAELRDDFDNKEQFDSAIGTIISSTVGFTVIEIIMNISLMYGAYKGIHLMLIPYLVTNGLYLLCMAIAVLIVSIACFSNGEQTADIGLSIIIIGGLYFGLVFYFWYAVYSLYHQLRREANIKANSNRLQEEGRSNSFMHGPMPPLPIPGPVQIPVAPAEYHNNKSAGNESPPPAYESLKI